METAFVIHIEQLGQHGFFLVFADFVPDNIDYL